MSVDFSRYSWKPLPGAAIGDKSLTREAAGGELMEYIWRGLGFGDFVVIFMAELAFSELIDATSLTEYLKNAWTALRYDVPTVAARTVYDEENTTHIIYTPARSADEAKTWASRTVRLVTGFDNIEQFRHSLMAPKAIRDDNGDQTFLYVLPHGPSASTCSVLVHSSHITFDAKGMQVLFTIFMNKLATSISIYPAVPYGEMDWGSEGKNVPPSPYDILGGAEVRDGPQYDMTLDSVTRDMLNLSQNEHGHRPRVSGKFALKTKRATFTFSERDSESFFAEVKRLGFTVNQVCHAALVLVTSEGNPVPEDKLHSAVFGCSHLMDGRHRLRSPYSNRDRYPGFCLSVSPVQIAAIALDNSATQDDKNRLIGASTLMKKEFERQKRYPSLLVIGPARGEMMIGFFKSNPNANLLPLIATGPWYSGDGKGELYLDHVYYDASGKVIVGLISYATSVNKLDPGPFFRIWSWRGRLTVSVDYNPNAMPEDVVEKCVERWKQYILCLSASQNKA